MAVLSDIPNEVLNIIIPHLHPRDLEAFLSVTKSLRIKYELLLAEHYQLKREHSVFKYHKDTARGAPARLLKAVLGQPRIASYVMVMDVEDWDTKFTLWKKPGVSRLNYTTEDFELFSQMLKDSHYISHRSRNVLSSELKKGNERPILIMLLSLLPNLEHIRIVNDHHFKFGDTVGLVADERPVQLLTRLKSVHLEARESDSRTFPTCLLHLRDFCKLPSIQTFSLHNSLDSRLRYDCDLKMDLHPSELTVTLTHLTLSSCAIHSIYLCSFLSCCNSLEYFEYWPAESFRAGARDKFDPHSVRAALQENCTNTLKTLTILAKGEPEVFMGSLQPFSQLTAVTTNLDLLIGVPLKQERTKSSTLTPYLSDESSGNKRLLSDMLPSHIVQLTLCMDQEPDCGSWEEKRLKGQIEQLLKIQDDKLPYLEKVIIGWPEGSILLDLALLRGTASFNVCRWPFLSLGSMDQWLDPVFWAV